MFFYKKIFQLISIFFVSAKKRRYFRYIGEFGSFKYLFRYLSIKYNYKKNLYDYEKFKKIRKADTVIYSCLTNGYDDVRKISCINFNYDYVMFTDRKDTYSKDKYVWKFKDLPFNELDFSRNSRYPKFNPHKLFPDYKFSVWLDSNIDIISNKIYEDIESAKNESKKIAIGSHPKRNCLYEEYKKCLNKNFDEKDILEDHIRTIKKDKFPENYGLFENSVIFRMHNDKDVVFLMEKVWNLIKTKSKRDQLSLVYMAWKNNIKIFKLGDKAYRNSPRDFIFFKHN